MEDPESVTTAQDIQFYAASITAWFNTALEHDKSILTLSAAGIGLLVTLLTTTGINSEMVLLFYMAAILCFLLSITCVLLIYNRNKDHIVEAITSSNSGQDIFLRELDRIVLIAFGAGVVFSVSIGISTGINSYTKEKQEMIEKNIIQDQQAAKESFNNINDLKAETNLNKKFSNEAKLQPARAPVPTAKTPADTETKTTPSS